MNVNHILHDKGVRVFTIPASAQISEAIGMLSERNIGALIVTDDENGVVGILSERDVVRQLGRHGADVLDAPVSAYMTSENLVTCTPQTSIDDLMGQMTDRRIRHIPVLREGALAGVISIGDVVKYKISEVEREAAALREYIAS